MIATSGHYWLPTNVVLQRVILLVVYETLWSRQDLGPCMIEFKTLSGCSNVKVECLDINYHELFLFNESTKV